MDFREKRKEKGTDHREVLKFFQNRLQDLAQSVSSRNELLEVLDLSPS